MKNRLPLTLFLLLLAPLCLHATSLAPTPFPAPPFSIEAALQKAHASRQAALGQTWIIRSATYGDPQKLYPAEAGYTGLAAPTDWCWFIVWANPQTGATSVDQITRDGKVHPLGKIDT